MCGANAVPAVARLLVKKLHASPGQFAVATTGGGGSCAGWLMAPGCSRTLLSFSVPYSRAALMQYLQQSEPRQPQQQYQQQQGPQQQPQQQGQQQLQPYQQQPFQPRQQRPLREWQRQARGCWSCGQMSHLNRDCPNPIRRCYNCGSADHINAFCDQPLDEDGGAGAEGGGQGN